jgi:hypothetical protein
MLEKKVQHDFFGILAFSDFLKTNFGICSTKNMGKYFVLSDKLLHECRLRHLAVTAPASIRVLAFVRLLLRPLVCADACAFLLCELLGSQV